MAPVTVLVAGRRGTIRRACLAALADSPDVRVVAEARSPAEVLLRARHARPRVVVLASALASSRGRTLLAALSAAPRLAVLVVAPAHPARVVDVLARGARGHVEPARVRRWLPSAVRAVARGEAWCSRALASVVIARVVRAAAARRAVPTDVAHWSNGRRVRRRPR